MVIVRPKGLKPSKVNPCPLSDFDMTDPGFIVHPPTSVLAEQLQVDPMALQNENYSGIYDENGDYIPQYCDDPEKIPQGAMVANSDKPSTPGGTDGGAGAPDDKPSNSPTVTTDDDSK